MIEQSDSSISVCDIFENWLKINIQRFKYRPQIQQKTGKYKNRNQRILSVTFEGITPMLVIPICDGGGSVYLENKKEGIFDWLRFRSSRKAGCLRLLLLRVLH